MAAFGPPARAWLRGLVDDLRPLLDPGRGVAKSVRLDGGVLWIGPLRIGPMQEMPSAPNSPQARPGRAGHVVALGKAAGAMVRAALPVLEELCRGRIQWSGVAVVPAGAMATGGGSDAFPEIRWLEGGHPVPTSQSFDAGRGVVSRLAQVRDGEPVVFLISGGGSSLCELPLPGVGEAELTAIHRRLVIGEGLDHAPGIVHVNRIRQRLSAVKGGRLLRCLPKTAPVVTLLVSDVPAGFPEWVSSGPTMTPLEPEGDGDAASIARSCGLWQHLSPGAQNLLGADAQPQPAEPSAPREVEVILSERDAERHAVAWLADRGVHVEVVRDLPVAPVQQTAEDLLAHLRMLRDRHPDGTVALVSTGECEVRTEGFLGVGGRNAHLALRWSLLLEGQPITALAWATDGVDGNSPGAGGVVDGSTAARLRDAGIDPLAALRGFDAHTALAAVGDAVVTGPTGTNVRDLRVLCF